MPVKTRIAPIILFLNQEPRLEFNSNLKTFTCPVTERLPGAATAVKSVEVQEWKVQGTEEIT